MELRDKFGMNFLFTNEGHYCNAREHATKSTNLKFILTIYITVASTITKKINSCGNKL